MPAAEIAVRETTAFEGSTVGRVLLVCFGEDVYDAYRQALARHAGA